jgi:hypothetical protein
MLRAPFWRGILTMHWRALKAAAETQARQPPKFKPKFLPSRVNAQRGLDQKSKAAGEREDDD